MPTGCGSTGAEIARRAPTAAPFPDVPPAPAATVALRTRVAHWPGEHAP